MLKTSALAFIALLLASCSNSETGLRRADPASTMTIAFYNVENLFDAVDDPTNPGDDEFLPKGKLGWTQDRLDKKLEDIARVIRSMDEYGGADIVGVCEVENRAVLDRLVNEFLPKDQYAFVHEDSEDERGIDVALLYRPRAAKFVGHTLHRVNLGDDKTRGILEATFVRDGHQFRVLVNHWPSRTGGQEQSEPKRIAAARTASRVIDSLYERDPAADIIMMGDMNDEPSDRSLFETLNAREMTDATFDSRMINLASAVQRVDTIGSYLYKGKWETIDHIMLSRGALDDKGITLLDATQTVFTPEFIRDTKADAKKRPGYRTYKGNQYIGGVSDHFPVIARVGWMRRNPNGE
ncbi:MAG: endonuclease/exonuclease/phosphatase family protein [bacterium]|nr:endonuclease/exonuclease/phosphatase family protein [Candidatus Kapabacteria bacterium]